MHPLQVALGGKLAQIATNRVLGNAQLLTECLGYELAIALEAAAYELFALRGEHGSKLAMSRMELHETA